MSTAWATGKAANKDRKLRLLRSANTSANYKYGMGGLLRKNKTVKPVTLPKLKFEDAKLPPAEGEAPGGRHSDASGSVLPHDILAAG